MTDKTKPSVKAVQDQLQQEADYSSSRQIVENSLAEVEADNSKRDIVCNDVFFDAVKKIRQQSEAEFLAIKARYGEIKGLLASDLNRVTRIFKKRRNKDDESSRETKADLLIKLVRNNGEFFSDEDQECYVSYRVEHEPDDNGVATGEHWETWNLRSKGFKRWANFLFYGTYKSTVGDNTMVEAVDTLSGSAIYEGEEKNVNLRYAIHGNVIYIDLGGDDWQVVAIDRHGWKIIESKEVVVKFVRSSIGRPLPMPEKGGCVDDLWKHLNLEDSESRLLVLAWLLESMRSNRPYPLLEIGGGQGSAKSTFQRRLRRLIDPNKVDLRSAPRNVEDIFVATQNNHVISYENLSYLTANQQDTFCILSTGGGASMRKLYSNTEEEAFSAMRPVMLNGISELATRPDLADRTVLVELKKIECYIPEAELESEWQKDYPKITGALYSLLGKTLAELPDVHINRPPRMADFVQLGQAMLNALEVDESFSEIFNRNRDHVVARAIEASPVALAVIDLLNSQYSTGKFTGTMKQLLSELSNNKPKFFDPKAWPKSPRGLGDIIKRVAPALLVRGINVQKDDKPKKDGYHITISKVRSVGHNKVSIEL